MKENIKSFIGEIIAATIFFGGLNWIFELISGNPNSVGYCALKGVIFAVLIVPFNRWILKRKKDKEQ